MVIGVRDGGVVGVLAVSGDAVLGERAVEYTGVYLGETESRDEVEFFGATGVYGAVFAVGADGVFARVA